MAYVTFGSRAWNMSTATPFASMPRSCGAAEFARTLTVNLNIHVGVSQKAGGAYDGSKMMKRNGSLIKGPLNGTPTSFWKLPSTSILHGLKVPEICSLGSLSPEALLYKAFGAMGCLGKGPRSNCDTGSLPGVLLGELHGE